MLIDTRWSDIHIIEYVSLDQQSLRRPSRARSIRYLFCCVRQVLHYAASFVSGRERRRECENKPDAGRPADRDATSDAFESLGRPIFETNREF